jgi:hypothetical protein
LDFDILDFDILDFDIFDFDILDFDILDFDILGFDILDFTNSGFDNSDFDNSDLDVRTWSRAAGKDGLARQMSAETKPNCELSLPYFGFSASTSSDLWEAAYLPT